MITGVGQSRFKRTHLDLTGGRVFHTHAINYIVRGHGFYEDQHMAKTEVGPGSVLVLRPGDWHCFDAAPGTTWHECWVIFDGNEAQQVFGPLLPSRGALFNIGMNQRFLDNYGNLQKIMEEVGPQADALRLYYFHDLLATLHLCLFPPAHLNPKSVVTRAMAWMKSRVSALEPELARFCLGQGISYEIFRKQFRNQTGVAPSQYFLNLKMSRAKEQLLQSTLPVQEIARECGFSSLYHFSKTFRHREGVSPRNFREQARTQNGE